MKILYLTFSFSSGGTEHLTVDICNEMIKRGHEVHLYIVNNFYDEALLKSISNKVHIELQNSSGKLVEKLATLIKVTRYICKNKIDIIHANSINIPDLLLLKPLFFPRVRVVQTIHDTMTFSKFSAYRVAIKNYQVNQFIAISRSVESDLIFAGVPENKVHVIYNAIDLSKFKNCSPKTFNSNNAVIGNVARINPAQKGQDILIHAIARLKRDYPAIQCRFAIAVCHNYLDQEENYKKILKLVKMLNLEDNVKFFENVDDIPNFLAQLDVFVLPSRFEGFGLSLVEAIAMEIPCIASNVGGPVEIIGRNARGILFENEDIGDLADKISQILSGLIKINVKTSAEYVRENFGIGKLCLQLEKTYKTLFES